ncbi:hypothetical protein GGTG_04210 [Gaeumannomyces tritici R3-111a-1]|uniref:General alpha-glucoside permease n=1 Tax=Gaeumannomyces tritici (strain R3-111a-1) TaxID=644352 RepID=J3NSF8_GAET3|nr:hypothetical protein GGTG_04210 [Gaeumannomyces tritici R3-111a-1]EJT79121.1 hypothetical protein GGTG_04210 [Gaeumannomyces tritici R3-111a-1]
MAKEPISAGKTSSAKLVVLALPLAGLQAFFAILTSYGTPYLQTLGVSKTAAGLLWLSGPLFGTLLQPCVGLWSDASRTRWGRRKPFMVVGAFGCALSLMALVHADTLSVWLTNSTGRAGAGTRTVALLALSFLNASIQPLQGASRAFLFDNTCPSRQSVAAAWASRATSFVNILFYFVGNVDLPRLLPFLGNTQAKVLALLAVAVNFVTLVVACVAVSEPPSPALDDRPGKRLADVVRDLVDTARNLPWRIKEVMVVQALSWVGWTPFLFYMSMWVCIYRSGHMEEKLLTRDEAATSARYVRIRNIVRSFGNPPFADITPDIEQERARLPSSPIPSPSDKEAFAQLTAASHRKASLGFLLFALSTASWVLLLPRLTRRLSKAQSARQAGCPRAGPAEAVLLSRVWLGSQLLFSVCMVCFVLASTHLFALALMALVGCPWAVTVWVPFALIGMDLKSEANEHSCWAAGSDVNRGLERHGLLEDENGAEIGYNSSSEDDEDAVPSGARAHGGDTSRDRGGAVFGLHNIAMAAPQILGIAACSFVFGMLVPLDEANSGPVFAIGVVSGILAAGQLLRGGLCKASTEICAS